MDKILYIVVPCYNEEEVLPKTAGRLLVKLASLSDRKMISPESRILFVDDGSKDGTWEAISDLCNKHREVFGIKLAHNKGHQKALLAGLMTAKEHADMVISIDADLQDDIDAIDKMIERHLEGAEIVYGVRDKREKDPFFKRTFARSFYGLMKMLGTDTIYDHADYRLMGRRALDALSKYKEVNLFLRGIVPMLGYTTDIVYYERGERLAGVRKYTFRKSLALAWDGITSFSIAPIRFITLLGTVMFAVSLFMMAYSVVRKLLGATVTGWSSLALSMWMIGGLVLLSIGIVGEYIGKIYLETKARPRYIIEKEEGVHSNNENKCS